jgi:hypothetical protein
MTDEVTKQKILEHIQSQIADFIKNEDDESFIQFLEWIDREISKLLEKRTLPASDSNCRWHLEPRKWE